MRLDELVGVDVAVVRVDGKRAGTLRRVSGSVQFQYDEDYRGPPVATTLPVRREPWQTGGAGAVPPFFAGLLPEGRRLTALRHAAKTSADDDLTMLLAVGADTVGNVTVVPQGGSPDASAPAPMGAFSDVRFADLFAQVLSRDPADRIGLPGVQDKVSGAMIALPVKYQDAGWILKLNAPEFPDIVANEAFFLNAAASSGIPVARHEIVHDADDAAGLLVRRFDRDGDRRFAQEDGCQVNGRYPADKYRLSSEELVQGLASVCGAPVVAARDLIRQLAFAYLSCNGDAHAKNFSVTRDAVGEWHITPAYDLPSSHPYGDTSMALPLNDKRREDIGRADFLALASRSGVREPAARRVIDSLLDALPGWLHQLDQLPFDARRVHKLRKAIEYRGQRLRE